MELLISVPLIFNPLYSHYQVFTQPFLQPCTILLTDTVSEIDQKFRQLKLANQKLARNSRAGNVFESIHVSKMAETSPSENAKVEETIVFAREVISQPQETATGRSSSLRKIPAVSLIVTLLLAIALNFRNAFP